MSDEKRDDPLDNFLAVIFIAIVMAILIAVFYIDAWYNIRNSTFKAYSFLPEPVRKVLVFYNMDLANTVPLMSEDLIFHENDFDTYYKENSTGIAKKRQIDIAALWLFMPWISLLAGILVIRELTRKQGRIDKPGGKNAMYNYARTQMEIWPFIKVVAPIMEKIARDDNLDAGPYAAPKIPIMWMHDQGLLNEVKTKAKRDLLTVSQRVQFTLDRPKAYKALVKNLGRPWVGVSDLTFVERCLFSVLVPHIYGKVKESRLNNRKILAYYGLRLTSKDKKKLNEMESELKLHVDTCIAKYEKSFETPYFDIQEFDDPYDPIISSFQRMDTELDMKFKGDVLIKDALLTHRYVKTVFFSLMLKSWTYGVLASSELLWVKALDRDLYYVMSQQGRNSAFVEVAGCWSHYLSESSYGFKMLSPQVYPAIRALDFDLFETHDNYIPHEDYDDSARWDKLVPDGINASAGFSAAKSGNATSKIY